jgi:hypothetical protein
VSTLLGWGLGPVGFTPWGLGSSVETFEALYAEVIGERAVEIEFSAPVYWSGLYDRSDAANPERYQITATGGGLGIEGDSNKPVGVASVERISETRIRIYTDRPFSSYGTGYAITTNRLISTGGEDLPGGVFYFLGSLQGLLPPLQEFAIRSRDFANPQTLRSLLDPLPDTTTVEQLGTYPVDETGDYAVDEGIANLRKRVVRRLTTRRGSFAHMPTYGTIAHENVKRLGRPGVRAMIANDAEMQIREEPDVVACSVSVELPEPGVIRYRIRVKVRSGQEVALEPSVTVE